MSGVTEVGKKRFGLAVRAARNETGKNQIEFAAWLTSTTNIEVGASQLRSLESATWLNAMAPNTIIAIVEAKILKFPDGKPFSFDDCIDVMRERLTLSGERIAPPQAIETNH